MKNPKIPQTVSLAAVKLLITALLLFLFIRRTDFGGVIAALSRLNLGLIIALVPLNIFGVLVAAYKWQMLLPGARFKELAIACFASYYVALLLPGQVAQEAAKAYYLSLGRSPEMHRIAASVVVDKIISIIGLLVVGCIGLTFTDRSLPQSLTWAFISSGLLAILLLFSLRIPRVFAWLSQWLGNLSSRLPRQKRIFNGGIRLFETWHGYSKNLPLLLEIL